MEAKKSPKADLEKKKGIFFEIGILFSLGILFFAFEWKADNSSVSSIETNNTEFMEEEVIPVTMHEIKLPPPPPPAPKLIDVFELIEDIDELDDILEIVDAEDESENNPIVNQEWSEYGTEDTGEPTPFILLEDPPKFFQDLNKWLSKNTKYPEAARMNNIQGKVIVEFIIEKDGSVSNAKILRSIDPILDKEALRVVNSMPKWIPGMQRKKPVRTTHQLPIGFYLN